MAIYDAIFNIAAASLTLSNGLLAQWVSIPANASGPLDPNITMTAPGAELVRHVAAAAVNASNILCNVFEVLF